MNNYKIKAFRGKPKFVVNVEGQFYRPQAALQYGRFQFPVTIRFARKLLPIGVGRGRSMGVGSKQKVDVAAILGHG